jgi:hypothetical protein
MFTVTPEQEYILSILNVTRIMRRDQAFHLLAKLNKWNTEVYTQTYTLRCLWQLKHIRRLAWKTDDVFTLPLLFHEPIDEEMLSAIDIMLDLTKEKILSVSVGPAPYKLSFSSEKGKDLKAFAIVTVKPGSEKISTILLNSDSSDGRIIIFLLSSLSQRDSVKTSLPHYFAILDGGRYRYFKN